MISPLSTYLLASALVLLVGVLLYYCCFLRSTFLQWNRILLWCILAASLGLPLVHLPVDWTVWQQPTPTQPTSTLITREQNEPLATLHATTNLVLNEAPQTLQATPQQKPETYSYTRLWFYLYGAGCLFFGLRFLLQSASLFKLYLKARIEQRDGYRLAICPTELSPFAFGSTIFIGASLYQSADLDLVITHELAHIKQRHTLDIVLAEFTLIWQWFNPGAWLYRKMVESNLEYLADRRVLQQAWNKKQYQLSLLNWATTGTSNRLASSYNYSLLKERIMMMNRKSSPRAHLFRYMAMGLCLPLFAMFNQPALSIHNEPSTRVDALDQQNQPQGNARVNAKHLVPAPQMKDAIPKHSASTSSAQSAVSSEVENTFVLIFSLSIDAKEQEELLKMALPLGKKLEFIRNDQGKLIGAKMKNESGGTCSVWYSDEQALPIIIYGQPSGCATGVFNLDFLDKLINDQLGVKTVITVGLPKDKAGLETYRPKIIAHDQEENKERLDQLALTNWVETSTSSGSTSYRIPVQESSWESVKKKISEYTAQGKEFIITVNGQVFNSVFPDIKVDKITKMNLYEGRRTEYFPGTLTVKRHESTNLRLELEVSEN